MAAPRHVLLELDEQGDLQSVGEESDAEELADAHRNAFDQTCIDLQLESAPEALRAAMARGRMAANASDPSLLSGFPLQGSGGDLEDAATGGHPTEEAPAEEALPPPPPQSSTYMTPPQPLDMNKLLLDIVPLLSTDQKRTFLEFLTRLQRRHNVVSIGAAIMQQAPSIVGADLWQQCIDLQRVRSPSSTLPAASS